MKLYKTKKTLTAIGITYAMLASMLVGCKKNEQSLNSTPTPTITTIPTTTPVAQNKDQQSEVYAIEKQIYNNMTSDLKKMFPTLSEETIKNTSLILLLDILAPADENGKIDANIISEFKSKIDSDNMMNEFNSFIDTLENTMITEKKIISISEKLPKEESDQKEILANIETITNNIIELSKDSKNKEQIILEFNKIYALFVEEDEMKINNVEFDVRDLNYSNRAIASAYARVANYYVRGYVSEEKRNVVDNRTNDQNNKAYIKTKLEVLSNCMLEKSETDIDELFYKEYTSLNNYSVSLTDEQTKYMINYLNLKYLDSDKVSNKDKNSILEEYNDKNINEAITAIDAITTYNLNNQNNLIVMSDLLVDTYQNTEKGIIDSIALDFVQYNLIMLLKTANKDTTKDNNPYLKNLYLFFTKQDFIHVTNEGEKKVVWQEVSDGTKFICNEEIIYTLNKLPKIEYIAEYKEIANSNLNESIQYIQNVVSGECERVEYNQYVKTK